MVSKSIEVQGRARHSKLAASLLRFTDPFQAQNSELVDSEEFDFDDVFGSVRSSHTSLVLPIVAESDDDGHWPVPTLERCTQVDSLALKVRSHSLVGPGPCASLSREIGSHKWNEVDKFGVDGALNSDVAQNFTKLTLSESEDDGSEKEADDGAVKVQSEEWTGPEKLGPSDFELLACVGQGGFAKVFLCRRNGKDDSYAMKVMKKSKIMEKNHGVYMKAERDILTKVVHPFIVQLQYSFQTSTKLYLILDFINGGHLFYQLYRQGNFSEELAKVYTAEIICAVGHLHSMGIMHRDLKPENILLDAEGHVKVTDFGLAKELDDSIKSNSLCGTVEYMAPEVMQGIGHGKAADWWSVGVLLFEMLTGRPPFIHANRYKLQQKIIKDKLKMPPYFTSEAVSLLRGLLQKDPDKRLGSGPRGTDEIREHKWFKSIVWRKVLARELQPKFKPSVNGKRCTANFDEMWTKLPLCDSPASTPKGGDAHFFKGYSYIAPTPPLCGSQE